MSSGANEMSAMADVGTALVSHARSAPQTASQLFSYKSSPEPGTSTVLTRRGVGSHGPSLHWPSRADCFCCLEFWGEAQTRSSQEGETDLHGKGRVRKKLDLGGKRAGQGGRSSSGYTGKNNWRKLGSRGSCPTREIWREFRERLLCVTNGILCCNF